MEKNNNTEDLMSLIFGTPNNINKKDETVLDLIDQSLESSVEQSASDVSQSNRSEDSVWTRRELLKIIEED